MQPGLGRRDFLKVAAATGGALVLGFYLPERPLRGAPPPAKSGPFAPNAWLRIASDGTVTIVIHKCEMGQGVATSLPQLLAEDLEADWSKVRVEFAPADKAYYTWLNPQFGMQFTGGSMSVRGSWDMLRSAGAAAREMLIAAAAQKWQVKPSECHAENGEVVGPGGKKLGYGALAAAAAQLPVPQKPPLKQKDFRFIGKRMPRLDTPAKVNGSAIFGIDVKVPGMRVARVVRCPVFGGKPVRFDAGPAKAVKGVHDVIAISSGVAVVADGYWPATMGIRALNIQWDEGKGAAISSETISKHFHALSEQPGAVARSDGDAEAALKSAARVIEAVYEVPFLAHATMEPQNCTAHVRKDGVEVWAPTQGQTFIQQAGAAITKLPPEKIKVHTTYLGGGFGRRVETDVVADAIEISAKLGVPIKVIWSREDDIQHDFYRPTSLSRLRAGLDKSGRIVAWSHRIVSPSIMSRVFPMMVQKGIDHSSVEGATEELPYDIPNLQVDYHLADAGIPVGFWRSVGHSQNAYATECFLDEVAAATRQDPLALRRKLLGKAPRHKAVLELAAAKAGWRTPPKGGRKRGLAVAESFGSYVAEVAEVSVDKAGGVKVHRVVCAIDCGKIVNPDTVEAQMQSGIIYGLSAALYGEITIDKGRVRESNFDSYPMVRMVDSPAIEVHIVPSTEGPGGVGEPGTPPIAPAVCNAIRAAVGKPIRRLPIRTVHA